METTLADINPFFPLIGAFLFVVGMLIGWLLRMGIRERDLSSTINSLRIQSQNLQTSYDDLQNEYNLRAADTRKAQLEAENLRVEANKLRHDKELDTIALENAQAHLRMSKTEREAQRQSMAVVEEQIAGLRTRNARLTGEVHRLQEDFHAANAQLELLQTSKNPNDALKSNIQQVQQSHQRILAAHQELEAIVEDLREDLAKSEAEAESLRQMLQQTEQSLVEIQSENIDLRSKAISASLATRSSRAIAAPSMDQIESQPPGAGTSVAEMVEIQPEMTIALPEMDALVLEIPEIETTPTPSPEDIAAKEAETALWTDDLGRVNGISTTIEKSLNKNGIFTLQQLSELDSDPVFFAELAKKLRVSQVRIQREDWMGQAKRLIESV